MQNDLVHKRSETYRQKQKDEGVTFYITLDKPEFLVINFDSLCKKRYFFKEY